MVNQALAGEGRKGADAPLHRGKTMRRGFAWLAGVAALFIGSLAIADGGPKGAMLRTPVSQMAPPPPAPVQAAPVEAAAAPVGKTGAVTLANGMGLTVPKGYVFFGPDVARAYLARIQKAAPAGELYGIVAPEGAAPDSPKFAGVVLTWNPMGRVPETGIDQLAAANFLEQVKNGRGPLAASPEAFAAQPAYDAQRRALAWGERYAAASPRDPNVRHEGRLLGRRGVTGATGYADASRNTAVKGETASVLAALAYPAGEGYGDFAAGKDPEAEFDVAGLITSVKRPGAAPPVSAASADAAPPAPAAPQNWLQRWFPWLAAALIGLPVLLWLIFGLPRNRRDNDRNDADDDDDDDDDDSDDDARPPQATRPPGQDPNVTPPQ
jgi:uncharacterized membrane-anchored protein